jgi:DNA-binding NtrC family response regulator
MADTPVLHNKKTILIVDDDAAILSFVAECLSVNYHVLTAASGEQALQRSKDFKDEIHLLLSDLQMPGMTGIDLATQITAQRPQLKALLMSGFNDGMLVLNEGWHFLPKPFIPSQLRTLVAGLIAPDEKVRFKAA